MKFHFFKRDDNKSEEVPLISEEQEIVPIDSMESCKVENSSLNPELY